MRKLLIIACMGMLALPAAAHAEAFPGLGLLSPNCDEQPYEGNPITDVVVETYKERVSVEWVPGADAAHNGSVGKTIAPIGWDIFIHKVGYPYRPPYGINTYLPYQLKAKEKQRLTVFGVLPGSEYTVWIEPTNAGLFEGVEWQSCGTSIVNGPNLTRKWHNEPRMPAITEASFNPAARWTVEP